MLTTQSALAKDRRNAKAPSKMQHRHFAWIAGLIANAGESDETTGDLALRRSMAQKAAEELQATNPNFDKRRFLAACDIRIWEI